MRVVKLMISTAIAAFMTTAAQSAETITYTHDVHGRLVAVVHSGTVNNGVTVAYTLDPVSNRINVVVTGH